MQKNTMSYKYGRGLLKVFQIYLKQNRSRISLRLSTLLPLAKDKDWKIKEINDELLMMNYEW